MQNRLERFTSLLALTIAFIVGASFVSVSNASGTDIVWVTKQIRWSHATADSQVAQNIGDETDTTRTVAVSTSDWAWDAFVSGPATGTLYGARLTFVSAFNNAAQESLYYVPEFGVNGKFNRHGNVIAGAASAGQCAVPIGANAIANVIYTGVLIVDPDAALSAANIWLAPEFRLVVAGDHQGTTPFASKVKVFITYPTRRASQ